MKDDTVLNALVAKADDRGILRTTVDELVADTGLSRSTVKRRLNQLSDTGLIVMRSKRGSLGGIQIKLPNGPQMVQQMGQQTVQNEPVRDVSARGAPPTGASPTLRPTTGSKTGSPSTSTQGPAYRNAQPHEIPIGGADLVYTGPDNDGKWRRITATLWQAPNGDTVSIRSMTSELRLRLRVDLNDDGTENLEAIRAIRGILDR